MIRPFAGHHPTIHPTCFVDPSAQVIGQVTLGPHSSVWMNAVLRGDVHSIHLGDRSNVQDGAVLHGQRGLYPVLVGSNVTIGHNSTVHGCTVEDACLIGIGAIILNNARIGAGSLIAAGALVPEHTVIPPRSLVTGVPGRVRRTLTPAEVDSLLVYSSNYVNDAITYRTEANTWQSPVSDPVAPINSNVPQRI